MLVSLEFLLSMASRGDDLAAEVVGMIMQAAVYGVECKVFCSFAGNSFTVKYEQGPGSYIA